MFLAGTKFGSTSNRVGSVDLRYVMPGNWTLAGQATTTHTQTELEASHAAGPGYKLSLKKTDNHVSFQNYYTDRSPGLNSTLGYIAAPISVRGRLRPVPVEAGRQAAW